MNRFSLSAVTLWLAAYAVAGAEWQGRVVDMGRAALPGAKVTLHPQGITTFADGNGVFHLSETASLGRLGARPPHAGDFPAGLRQGHRTAPEVPARDLAGRRLPTESSRWTFIAPLRPLPETAPTPHLAKGAGTFFLVAEKPGFLSARVDLSAGMPIPDIVLVPGLDLSRPVLGTAAPQLVPRLSSFPLGSTSTEIPNVASLGERPSRNPGDYTLGWRLQSDTGIQVFVRPHDYAPGNAGSAAGIPSDANSGDSGVLAVAIVERAPNGTQGTGSTPKWGDYVNLLLWKKAPGKEYGAMKWLQFLGPIPAITKLRQERQPSRWMAPITGAIYTGATPPLDTCGRLAGKVAWNGSGAPELWVGMIGSELFTKVGPDGTFLTGDLPPGPLPLTVMRPIRQDDGEIVARTFYPLEGVTIVSGQTSVLDPIVLAAE